MKTEIQGFKCNRCGWEWIPRVSKYKEKESDPVRCPHCQSDYWNKERIENVYPPKTEFVAGDEPGKSKDYLLRDIPQELWKRFRLKALQNEMTLRKIFFRLMSEYVDSLPEQEPELNIDPQTWDETPAPETSQDATPASAAGIPAKKVVDLF
jgi:DNA-directed RNA polymerase subunit RPC12/RpoP